MRAFFNALFALSLFQIYTFAQIEGTVFRDYNLNALQDTKEHGIMEINVTLYDVNNTAFDSVLTDENGSFSFEYNRSYRLELHNIPPYLSASACGKMARPKVLFTSNEAINIGLTNPDEYCDYNAKLVTMFYQNGEPTSSEPSLVSFRFDADDGNESQVLASNADIGAVWGLAYDTNRSAIYASSLVKRHTGLKEKTGSIFKIDANGTVEHFIDVPNSAPLSFPTKEERNLSKEQNNPNHDDPRIFSLVGRTGIGDIDISSDGKTLYAMNLYMQELVFIDVEKQRVLKKLNIPHAKPFGWNCFDENVRPWAVSVKDDEVYVGAVCENIITNGVDSAVVLRLNDSQTGFEPFFSMKMNYDREPFYSMDTNLAYFDRWHNWEDNASKIFTGTYPVWHQPILSDIAFDKDGSMILGFIDRLSLQTGHKNLAPDKNDTTLYFGGSSGDTIKVCNVNGSLVVEGEAGCAQHTNDGHTLEFFTGDEFDFGDRNDSFRGKHWEITQGGLAVVGNSVAVSAFDPINLSENVYTNGVVWMDSTTGEYEKGHIVQHFDIKTSSGFGKAGGMGDLEAFCDSAPIEIGNLVWNDINLNGIQDASEYGIPNVTLKLYESNQLIGEAHTNRYGEYYFGGASNLNLFEGVSIQENRLYTIVIETNNSALQDANLSPSHQGAYWHDSDGVRVGQSIAIEYNASAENNHTLDIGLHFENAIGDRVWLDSNKNGAQDGHEQGMEGIAVSLMEANVTLSTIFSDENGSYTFHSLMPKAYRIKVANLPNYCYCTRAHSSDDAFDSDANSTGYIDDVNVSIMEYNMSYDVGLYFAPPSSPSSSSVSKASSSSSIQSSSSLSSESSSNSMSSSSSESSSNSTSSSSSSEHSSSSSSQSSTPPPELPTIDIPLFSDMGRYASILFSVLFGLLFLRRSTH